MIVSWEPFNTGLAVHEAKMKVARRLATQEPNTGRFGLPSFCLLSLPPIYPPTPFCLHLPRSPAWLTANLVTTEPRGPPARQVQTQALHAYRLHKQVPFT